MRLGSIVSAWLYQQAGGAEVEAMGFHAPVYGQLSNTAVCLKGVCGLMIRFLLIPPLLNPTGPNREAALEAYRGPGAPCRTDAFPLEALLLLGVATDLCVCGFCMNMPASAYLTLVAVNAHPSVSLCMTHVGM